MTLVTKTQIVTTLASTLQCAVKEKHLKIVAFAQIEGHGGDAVTLTEFLVVRDRPNVNEEHHHLLTFERGTLTVTEAGLSLAAALESFAKKVTPKAKLRAI